MQRTPAWPGAHDSRNQPIPFIDIEIPNHLSLSTLDGLQLDLIDGPLLHGGFYGDYLMGPRQRQTPARCAARWRHAYGERDLPSIWLLLRGNEAGMPAQRSSRVQMAPSSSRTGKLAIGS